MFECEKCGVESSRNNLIEFNESFYCNFVCADIVKCKKCKGYGNTIDFFDFSYCSEDCKNIKSTKNAKIKNSRNSLEEKEDFLKWIIEGNKIYSSNNKDNFIDCIKRLNSIEQTIFKDNNINIDKKNLILFKEYSKRKYYLGLVRGFYYNKETNKYKKFYDLTSEKENIYTLIDKALINNLFTLNIIVHLIDKRKSINKLNREYKSRSSK